MTNRTRYAMADSLGYGWCPACAPTDRPLNRYTADPGERCDGCGVDLYTTGTPAEDPGIIEYTPCRIF